MALKTFNIDEEVYRVFSEHCKKHGISMSRKVENFIKEEMEKMGVSKVKVPEIAHREHSFGKYC